MKQIEPMKYECPDCGSSLGVQSVDFGPTDAKTIYICNGCQESFYCTEKAHVSPPDRAPELKCLYCEKICDYLSLQDDWTDYWKCDSCRVTYEQSYSVHSDGLETINMYTRINNRTYVLRQFLWREVSRIDMIPDDPEDTIIIVKDFIFLLPQVKPANIQEKLKTYILFS